MVITQQCKELTGHIVELQVEEDPSVGREGFRCRLVSIETRNGDDVVYFAPVDPRREIGLALPVRFIRSVTIGQRKHRQHSSLALAFSVQLSG